MGDACFTTYLGCAHSGSHLNRSHPALKSPDNKQPENGLPISKGEVLIRVLYVHIKKQRRPKNAQLHYHESEWKLYTSHGVIYLPLVWEEPITNGRGIVYSQ
jgi:hypothetical protein